MRYIQLLKRVGNLGVTHTDLPPGVEWEELKNSFIVDDTIIAEYYGDLSEETLPTWEGVKPTVKEYLKNFTPEQLHESFTASEACAALKSSNPDVRAQAELLSMKRNKTIKATDSGYQTAIDDLEADGVLTADIAAEYRNGIPVDRM